MKKNIPNRILTVSSTPITLFEIESLRFPLKNTEPYLLYDAEDIVKRQAVFRDLLNDPALYERYQTLGRMIDDLADFYQKSGEDRDNEAIIYSLIKMQAFTEIIEYVKTELSPSVASGAITHWGFIELIKACESIAEDAEYGSIKSWLENLDSNLKNLKSITLGVNLNAQLRVSEVGITSFNTQPYVGGGVVNSIFRDENPGKDYECMISLGISETKKLLGKNAVRINNEFFSGMNTVFRGLLKKIKADVLSAFKHEAMALSQLRDDLGFINRAAGYMLSLKEAGVSLAFPRVSENHRISGLYNPNLLKKLDKRKIVANNVALSDKERLFVLTGPNSGGKTVYLNSIGIAQLMLQLGLPVPAAAAEMKPAQTIATLYVRNSGVTNDGRLAAEASRLKECLQCVTGDSLLLLDETFSGTGAFDGVFLAESLIKHLSRCGCRAGYITHFHELPHRLRELNKTEGYNVQLMCAENADGKRTYKIVPHDGTESETSLAREIVIENGLGFLFE